MMMLKHKRDSQQEKMFNIRIAILCIMFLILSTLHAHTTEGKVQIIHRHHIHNNDKNNNLQYKYNADIVIKQNQQHLFHHHHHQHQHQHKHHQHHHLHQHQHENEHSHPHSHQNHLESQQRKYAATPILEFTTSSSSSAIQSDNEFLIKQPEKEQQQQQQQQEQQETPLNSKDEIRYRTKEHKFLLSSTSSTTSQPTFAIHLIKHNEHKIKSENLLKTFVEHTRHTTHFNDNRSIPMVLLNQKDTDIVNIGNSQRDSDNIITTTTATATTIADPYENSKLNLATDQQHHTNQDQLRQTPPNEAHKQEYDRKHETKYIYEDYYGDDDDDGYGDENYRNDEEVDIDENDYNEDDKNNIDNISYNTENNLSNRSYARIIRSKIEDDYAEDEPYRNGINDYEMQNDGAPGILTEQKYLEVGNEKAVQQARERYVQEQKRPRTPHELATEHWHRMIQATKCRKPLPRVIPVSNNTSKRYEPYATILHRCGDDTGCCGSTASVCTVKRYETVMVYVFSYDFNYRKEIEALPMQNHTECHCVNRGSLLHDSMPRDKRSGGSYLNHFQRQKKRQHSGLQSYLYSQHELQQQSQIQNMFDCHCPRHFNVFEEDIERHANLPTPHNVFIQKCRCDCVINNQTCLRFKNGEEGFSLEDRKCIQDRNCKPPVCLYGDYNLRIGRCPSNRSLLQLSTS